MVHKKEAHVYYKKAADAGYKKAIKEYAYLIGGSFFGDPDKVEKYKYNLIGSLNGINSCICSLAYDCLNKDCPFYNLEEAEKYWKYLAFKGDKDDYSSHQFEYGKMLLKGEEVPQDIKKLLHKIKKVSKTL